MRLQYISTYGDMEKKQPLGALDTPSPSNVSSQKSEVHALQLNEVDEAYKLYELLHGCEHVQATETQRRRVLRKIDFIMLPVMCIVYGLQFLDKTTLSYASVMGISKDIGLTKNEYNWLASVFYFGKPLTRNSSKSQSLAAPTEKLGLYAGPML